MIRLADLPTINAILNAMAFVCLVVGYTHIRRGHIVSHRRWMTTAYAISMVFLGTYLTYRFLGEEKRFQGVGFIRYVYFPILITHVILAATVPFLGTLTLYWGWRGRISKHRRLAKWTLPIWMYVSVTGVVVYVFLFKLYGPVE